MHIEARGHPLHTRALRVTLSSREDKLEARAYLIDLRKRGFVPVGGDLQGPGIVHHMLLRAVVDPRAGVLESISAEQPAVAFESSPLSAGESCRDPIRLIESMAGAPLDGDFARRLNAVLGGPRGCSHILTLAQLLGSTAVWALEREAQRRRRGGRAWRAGERVFARDVIVDGSEPSAGEMQLSVQLTDIHCAPAAPVARPLERLGQQLEVRLSGSVDMRGVVLGKVEGAERRRRLDDLEAPWVERTAALEGLEGTPLLRGITRVLLARFGEAPDDRPLLDALLMMAPAFVQCAAALSEPWAILFKESASVVAMGGFPDSCYMWRRGGALDRARSAEEPPPRLW